MLPIELPPLIDQWRTRTSSSARLWGLALGADLAIGNRSRLDCLHTGYSRRIQRQSLKFWWSVTSADELRYQLQSLFDGGHDDLFGRIVYVLREEIPLAADLDQATVRRVEFVRRRWAEASAPGHIRAFDLGRVPNLARFGYTGGFISAAQAWDWVARAAVATQPFFGSWQEFAANYLLGHAFWDAADPDTKDYFAHREYLLYAPKSPWARLPWNTPLNR